MTDERIIVGLDIGTTKICTVIGEIAADGVLDIIGEGTVPSDGLRKGVVVNLERTITSVRQSIAAAERVAGVEVKSAWVGVAGSHLKAMTSHGMAAIRRGQEVTQADVERTIENARAVPLEANMEMIHVIPQEYVVDGNDGIKDPVGHVGGEVGSRRPHRRGGARAAAKSYAAAPATPGSRLRAWWCRRSPRAWPYWTVVNATSPPSLSTWAAAPPTSACSGAAPWRIRR